MNEPKYKVNDYVGVKSYHITRDKNDYAHFTGVGISPAQIIEVHKYKDDPYWYRIYFAETGYTSGYGEHALIPLTKEAYDAISNDERVEDIDDIEFNIDKYGRRYIYELLD